MNNCDPPYLTIISGHNHALFEKQLLFFGIICNIRLDLYFCHHEIKIYQYGLELYKCKITTICTVWINH